MDFKSGPGANPRDTGGYREDLQRRPGWKDEVLFSGICGTGHELPASIEALEQQVNDDIHRHSGLHRDVKLVTSIPGPSHTTAAKVFACLDDVRLLVASWRELLSSHKH